MEQKISKGLRTRRTLIQSSIYYFNKFGYQQVRLEDLMKSLGLTTGVFYANFETKEDLLSLSLETQIQDLKKALFFSGNDLSSEDWIVQFIEFYLSTQHRDFAGLICPLSGIALELAKNNHSENLKIQRYRNQLEGFIQKRLLDCGLSQSWSATGLLSMCVGSLQMARTENDSARSKQILEDAKQSLLKLLMLQH